VRPVGCRCGQPEGGILTASPRTAPVHGFIISRTDARQTALTPPLRLTGRQNFGVRFPSRERRRMIYNENNTAIRNTTVTIAMLLSMDTSIGRNIGGH
jgi:hypothetical protein